jgi:maltooligosyltrehalose trehalohydrolase
MAHFVKAMREGFVYSGQYSVYRRRRHGSSSFEIPAERFVVFSQNHDQIGNRMLGERLAALVSFEALKLAAGAVVLSPYIPMLFMGEEYGEESPFLYFVSHSDAPLIEAVRKGRKEEFQAFKWLGEAPDPQSIETFLRSKLRWEDRTQGRHRLLLDFYGQLFRLRKRIPALGKLDKNSMEVTAQSESLIMIERWRDQSRMALIMSFDKIEKTARLDLSDGRWKKIIDSAEQRWFGPGSALPQVVERKQQAQISPQSFALYEKES